jgi:hypothetical protein
MQPLVKQAIQNGADYGRNGKGVVYVYSGGNNGGDQGTLLLFFYFTQ